jgi:hypothetical protein
MQERNEPRQKRRRLSLAAARREAERVEAEARALRSLYEMLERIVDATLRGIVL